MACQEVIGQIRYAPYLLLISQRLTLFLCAQKLYLKRIYLRTRKRSSGCPAGAACNNLIRGRVVNERKAINRNRKGVDTKTRGN